MALAVAMAIIGAIVRPVSASVPATVLTSARIEHRGPTLELHFGFNGPPPRLDLSTHDSELWIELPRTRIAVPPRPLFGQETPPILSVRAMQSDGHSRIVVQVLGKSDYAIARLKDQNEIVFRIAAAGTDPNIAAPIIVHNRVARRPAPPVAEPVAFTPPADPRPISVPAPVAPESVSAKEGNRQPGHFLVMIDPGHGGYDPGTQSSSGAMEKDLALQIAMRLKSALEARGIHAELTRSTDTFISLPDRTKIANRADADL
ncbi:MAG TPA: N-acetylmuramoyl-L-alanine amidase, partial [Candidatus Binatus sp.]|nr:N-acetylmuramoyl-L-alanine amidase [Candidatus Binatus sp.]